MTTNAAIMVAWYYDTHILLVNIITIKTSNMANGGVS